MRSLAYGNFTQQQVEAVLRAGTGAVGCRFDILDQGLQYLAPLPGVTAAKAAVDVDRTIKGSIDMTLLPYEDLRNRVFQRYIRAWFRVLMPDNSIAEWPVGTYLWDKPKRRVDARGVETWTITLGDRGHVLDLGGPGPAGYVVNRGDLVTDAMKKVLAAAGMETTGVRPATSVVSRFLVYNLTLDDFEKPVFGIPVKASGQPTTWGAILTELAGLIGYYSPWFTGEGVPQLTPTPDLAYAQPSVWYRSGSDSILRFPVEEESDMGKICNRAFVRGNAPAGGHPVGVADANALIPNHPLAQRQTRIYIDATEDAAGDVALNDLKTQARNLLMRGLSNYQITNLPTFPWPAHEAFDVVGVQVDADPGDLGSETRWHEGGWSLDMFTGAMTHTLRRLVDPDAA